MNRSTTTVLAVDVAIVVSFVLFGRETHESPFDIAESTRIAAPFMAGLGLAWLIPTIRSASLRLIAGLIVGAVTAAVGMVLRSAVFGDGVSGAFPIVATAYLVGLMSLSRVALALVAREKA
ncbi:MAG: DUF3054 domain-containing protein [Acidimicrobiia bacterium]|nr:DUF3054 domain-containing protein [Acidimicrobiia bacterium]